eukprot:6449381-Pyramimonas_sp.AAC.1
MLRRCPLRNARARPLPFWAKRRFRALPQGPPRGGWTWPPRFPPSYGPPAARCSAALSSARNRCGGATTAA